ncbi:23S rRNA (uracil(1939)-C(5))-methyltransferase RlmD [[Clostridium] fimetarium]|uniref:23S rRNA (Uracil-5-)-methyltransferase RumA n=1 Tax=[Clostridium] fimetarium TaxID=99656 RepID=A0A1I0M9K2_9FIRM|nr:23S rRNA (uracil(1939)-C(5))-methyltransferase RlmD [[Clostridium] fimetarium]SEV84654.1 23S rRNA (uracil-5-)-methyltransferase RumA [[Clostridium] fimetarium]
MEIFDIRNEDGSVTGKTKERELVHRDGDIHGTSHVWIIRKNKIGTFDVLLQLRSKDKDAFPDCYDISSAGHILAGQDYLESALRELEEELGIKAKKKDLKYLGMYYSALNTEFYGKPFINNEISAVYIYDKFVDILKLQLQTEEVQSVRWMEYTECRNRIKAGTLKHAIILDEFLMLGEAVKKKLEQENQLEKQNIAAKKVELNNSNLNNSNLNNIDIKNGKSNIDKSHNIEFDNNILYNNELKNNSIENIGSKKNYKKCSVSEACGGCQFQGVPYKEQLSNKQKFVEQLFKGYCQVKPIVGMDNPLHYRNKVHAVVGENKDHEIISGTYKAGTHFLVPVESCMLEDEKADAIVATLRRLFKSFKYKPYNEDKSTGLIRHILIKRGFKTNQIMVVVVTASHMVPSKNNFVDALRKAHPDITTIVQNINDRTTSMVLGEKENVWYGKGYIEDILCDRVFRISSKSFYQINSVQTEHLYNTAIQMAQLTGKETIIDAYCGIGTIGIVASKYAKKVIGIELNKDAVKDAIANAKRNGISNCYFHEADAGKFMLNLAQDTNDNEVDVVVMDPPRSGSTEEFLNSVAKLNPKKVIYISCDPKTQIRDIEFLKKKGYKVVECRPFDMFPFTEHVETIVALHRKDT